MANDERIPCLDDMCTGTINERGVCNYCGTRGPTGAIGSASDSAVAATPAEVSSSEAAEGTADVGAAFDPEERVPCADDMCTGTLNQRGVCNYCGRAGR